jgi:glycosyltransferase involved in cell wall biosynthesis
VPKRRAGFTTSVEVPYVCSKIELLIQSRPQRYRYLDTANDLVHAMRIAFVMPQMSPYPIGGAKTVYQYADALAARGHHVVLVHPRESLLRSVRRRLDVDPELSATASNELDSAVEDGIHDFTNPHPWYFSRSDVQNLVVPSLAEEWIDGRFDLTIVNNQQAVSWVQAYSPRMGRKIYFLQDYESYMLGEAPEREETRQTLHIDWPIICTSFAGMDLVKSVADRSCHLVRNGIDTALFRPTVPIECKERTLIGFPARIERTKRTMDAVRAAQLVRPQIPPDVTFWCFGSRRISGLPAWIIQHVAPEDTQLVTLYNRSKLFLVPSQYEGFGRPGAEAMACGAALISSANDGVQTYAKHEDSAILCPPCDPPLMAAAITRLMNDECLRRRIAQKGASDIALWSMHDAAVQFEQTILGIT